MPASSNDVQRLFLQAIFSRRILSQKLAAKIWEKCIDAVKGVNDTLDIHYRADRNSWDDCVTSINDALNPLDLEFAHLHDEVTGQEVYAVVNRKGDEIAQMATDYSALEIAYFKAVLEQIMLSPNESFCVSSLAALQEVNSLKSNMTKSQAEATLHSFVAKGWLLKSRRGRYSLSTRTVLELQTYLRTTYEGEVIECTICMELVTRGVGCPTQNCKTRLHKHCFTNYRRRNNTCPSCKEAWSDGNDAKLRPVGEAAFREGQDQGRRRVRRGSTSDQEDGDETQEHDASQAQDDDAMNEDPGPSQSQRTPPRTQMNTKGKGKGKKRLEEADEEDTPPTRTQPRRTSRRG